MGCITSKGQAVAVPAAEMDEETKIAMQREDAFAREAATRMERVRAWVMSIPAIPPEEQKQAMEEYLAMRERDAEREREMVSGMSHSTLTTKNQAHALSLYTSKRTHEAHSDKSGLVPTDHESPPTSPSGALGDANRTMSSKTLSKAGMSTSYLANVQEEKEENFSEEGVMSNQDANVLELLRTLRSIIGSTKNLKKEFVNMDLNGDHLVSLSEFHFACAAMGTGLRAEQITAVFKLVDLNKNGVIEFDEFIEAFDTKSSLTAKEFLEQQRAEEQRLEAASQEGRLSSTELHGPATPEAGHGQNNWSQEQTVGGGDAAEANVKESPELDSGGGGKDPRGGVENASTGKGGEVAQEVAGAATAVN